jgi:hypothetical protein
MSESVKAAIMNSAKSTTIGLLYSLVGPPQQVSAPKPVVRSKMLTWSARPKSLRGKECMELRAHCSEGTERNAAALPAGATFQI